MGKSRNRRKLPRAVDPTLCRQCGRCCCAKLIIDGEIVYTPYYCKYLDRSTRHCTIYERRSEVNPDCLGVLAGIRLGVFPADCPYVQGIKNYRPPRERWTKEERALFGYLVQQMSHVDAEHVEEDKEASGPCK